MQGGHDPEDAFALRLLARAAEGLGRPCTLWIARRMSLGPGCTFGHFCLVGVAVGTRQEEKNRTQTKK